MLINLGERRNGENFAFSTKFLRKMGALAIFSLGGALWLRTIEVVRFRFAEKTQIFFSGGELGSTGRAKRELRVEVDRWASLKAD